MWFFVLLSVVGVITDIFLFVRLREQREATDFSRNYWEVSRNGIKRQLDETAARLMRAETVLEEAVNAKEAAEERAEVLSERLAKCHVDSLPPEGTDVYSTIAETAHAE